MGRLHHLFLLGPLDLEFLVVQQLQHLWAQLGLVDLWLHLHLLHHPFQLGLLDLVVQ